MIVAPQETTSLTNLLSSFNNENEQKAMVKPNINMRIESSNTNNTQNKRTVKKVRCKGKLTNRGGKFVPEVVCTSDNIQLPKMEQEQNRNNLLKVILGEDSKNKEENETMPFEANEHPLKVEFLPKKSKKPCGCRKKMGIDSTPPVELFPEMSKVGVLPVDTNSNDNGEELGMNNNNTKQTKKTKLKRKRKGSRSSKRAKHKIVQLTLKGEKPKIPTVNVVRKKKEKGTKKKKQKKSSKAE